MFDRIFRTSYEGTPVLTPQKARYKGPSGQEAVFDYEDVETSISTKAGAHELASGSGTYVQSRGNTGGRYPMDVIFSGTGYEKKASAFLGLLLESGVGVLTHPVYGPVHVVPVGEIVRTDAFVSAANEARFRVTFYETTGLQIGGQGGYDQAFAACLDASAVDFSEKVSLSDPVSAESFKQRVMNSIKNIRRTMRIASEAVKVVSDEMDDVSDSINRGLDVTVGQPLALARQVQILIGEPRREASLATSKLDGYRNMARDIFTRTLLEPSKYTQDTINQFHLDRLIGQAIVANHAMLSIEASSKYLTRANYLTAADNVLAICEEYQAWHDLQFAEFVEAEVYTATTDTGDGMADLVALMSTVAGELVGRSFSGKTEMLAELDGDRTPLDLCFELYGTVSDVTFDQFVQSNHLAGGEYFLIPKGREIVWYV